MTYLGSHKFNFDVVDNEIFQKALALGNKKWPNSLWQIRTHHYLDWYGSNLGIQIVWYTKEETK